MYTFLNIIMPKCMCLSETLKINHNKKPKKKKKSENSISLQI